MNSLYPFTNLANKNILEIRSVYWLIDFISYISLFTCQTIINIKMDKLIEYGIKHFFSMFLMCGCDYWVLIGVIWWCCFRCGWAAGSGTVAPPLCSHSGFAPQSASDPSWSCQSPPGPAPQWRVALCIGPKEPANQRIIHSDLTLQSFLFIRRTLTSVKFGILNIK